MLIELRLIDFMSHKDTLIRFHPGFNVFFGRKGSGKTAILEAIRLLFGGIGRERAHTLSSMIRYGANKAIIRAKLRNRITLPNGRSVVLVPEYPLDEIVIERIIYSDGRSVYKLNGSVVTKSHVQRLLSKVNISAQNTLFFLPQERVNEWIRLKPSERFDLLLSALGLKELKDKLSSLRDELAERRRLRAKYMQSILQWERRLEELKKKIAPTPKVKEFFDRYFSVKVAYISAYKAEIEAEIEELRRREEELRGKLEELERMLRGEEATREIDEEISAIEKELENIRLRKMGIGQEIGKLEAKESELMNVLAGIDDRTKKLRETLQSLEKKYGTTSERLIREKIKEMEEEIAEIEEQLEEHELSLEIRRLEERIRELSKELKLRERELEERTNDLHKMLSSLGNAESMRKVVSFVRSHRNSGVFGPIIYEISIVAPFELFEDIAPIVEGVLGAGVLRALMATTPQAYERIMNFLKRLRDGDRYAVYTFGGGREEEQYWREVAERAARKRRTIEERVRKFLRMSGLGEGVFIGWLMDFISAPPPVKALLEARFWNFAIVVDLQVAKTLLFQGLLKRVIALNERVVLERRDSDIASYYTSRVIPDSVLEGSVLLKAGLGGVGAIEREIEERRAEIRDLRDEIQRLKDKIKALERAMPREFQELLKRKQKLMESVEELRAALQEILRAKRLYEGAPERARRIRQTLQKIRERMDELEEELESLDRQAKELMRRLAELKNRKEELVKKRTALVAQRDALRRELEEIPARIRGLERIKSQLSQQIEETRRRMKAVYLVFSSLGMLDGDVDEYIKKKVLRVAESLVSETEIKELEKMLSTLEEDVRFYEEEVFKKETKLEEIEESAEKIAELKRKIKELDEESETIRKLFAKELQEMFSELRSRVEAIDGAFKRILSLLGASGAVRLEGDSIDKMELRIYADIHRSEQMEIERGNFSSGEKTTIIMALIMALLLISPPPLFMFDEFDVYLDDMSLKELGFIMKQSLKGFQGIITTTHREEIIELADRLFYVEFDERSKASVVRRIPIEAGGKAT